MDEKADEYDSPWKDVLRRLFPQFLDFFFPAVYAAIDWTQKPEFLDKELHKSVPEAVTGRRTVDALVKVRTLAGVEEWLFIHIEVQSQVDPKFAERMFIYAYRLYDRHQQLVVSLAVLGDDSPNWRPAEFALSSLTSAMSFRFRMVKLLDYSARWEELAESSNPFALVVMAHRQAVRTDQDSVARVDAKTELARCWGCDNIRKRRRETYSASLTGCCNCPLPCSRCMRKRLPP
ncbi:MAG: hypothetical protein IPK16_07090 [Anaerolineales bacterium]|nr:hypothetical protein [Anaerolineales bacterium]